MAFKTEIKNIGKLSNKAVRIGEFTVFAGPNNTGKSFVSKLLYSLFSAMNTNHVERRVSKLLEPVERDLNRLALSASRKQLLSPLSAEIEKLKDLVNSIDNFKQLYDTWPRCQNKAGKMQGMALETLNTPVGNVDVREGKKFQFDLNRIKDSLDDLACECEQPLPEFIRDDLRDKIQQNLVQNFQIPELSALTGKEGVPSEINVDGFGTFKFSIADEEVDFCPDVSLWQWYDRVIYLESPVYWKLKNALEVIQSGHWGKREPLSGVPGYFYDLARALKFEYTGKIAFLELYERLIGKQVMGGKIAISESGDLSFQENGRSFSLPVTALGIANIGILALLIERKVLTEDTFLFIDEPEAHLHPAWQVIMADALFELARQGVNVVITTHSVDVLKWLEVHVKKNPEDEQRIALNQFSVNDDAGVEDFETQMAKIKQGLTKPFSDLYLEGL